MLRSGPLRCFRNVAILVALAVPWIAPAWALEKYGRPLPALGDAAESAGLEAAEQPWLRGYLLTAAFFDNPTFAARPDNTGLVGLRHMLHLETDLYKQYLQSYTDQNFFSDRRGGWIALSEWDATFAFTGSLGTGTGGCSTSVTRRSIGAESNRSMRTR